jgi:hypothetical protein
MNHVIADGQNLVLSVNKVLKSNTLISSSFFCFLGSLLEDNIYTFGAIDKKSIIIDLIKFPLLEKVFIQLGWNVIHRATGSGSEAQSDDFTVIAESLYSASQPYCHNIILMTGDGELALTVKDYVEKFGKGVYFISVQGSLSPMIKNTTKNYTVLSSKDINHYFNTSVDAKLSEVELLLESIKRPVFGHELGKILTDNKIIFPHKGNGGMKKWLSKSSRIIMTKRNGTADTYHINL